MSGGYTPGLRTEPVDLGPSFDFLASEHHSVKRAGITLDSTLVTADADGNKIVKGGSVLGKVTATGKYGPYLHSTNEVQRVEVTAATDGTFTLTFDGQTTAAIAYNAAAADMQTALEGLPNIASGDVTATGGPLSTAPVDVEFAGQYLGTDVPQMTSDNTNLVGTGAAATVTTVTAGGAEVTGGDGREVATGILFAGDLNLRHGDVICGLMVHGSVLEARCTGVDPAAKADLAGRIWFQ
jgi:hypothetical protein